jgi:hypothetical protein
MGFFWYAECEVCRQGRLMVEVDVPDDKLYLTCEECTASYWSIEDANQDGRGFIGISAPFESRIATAADIERHDWSRDVLQYAEA